ncbi:unnamed protein product [Lymnaea stagnalis]|uniref:C-type lectin domain-containing protein n=1 Tax=Lymnaea stagnalis TaxID=6523 RepID=A0AAV2HWU6_LYMST
MSVSNGCQLYTISDQCQQGWYQVEHKCILLPNKMARKQVAASDGCKHLGGNLLSDPISDQVKECILRKSSTEIWIDNVGGKPQQCGIMNLTSQRIIRVRCNQTMTTPRSYVCESNSSSATYTATLENIITQTSTSDIGFPTLSTKVTPRPAVSYTTSGTNNTNLTSTDQAHTDMNTNGPVAWTTPLGSPTTATTGAEDIRPSTAEVPIFPNQTEFGNEPTKQKEAGKGLLETASTGILCPPGFDWIHQACYKFVQDELDWDKAFTYCKASNGDLSKIISPREKDNIQKYLASRYPSIQSWWMGFKGESTTEWAWLDGTAVDPNMIPWNNPYLGTLKRELCGTIETKDAKLQISGSICSTAKPFICEYHAMTPRHEVSSTTLAVPIQDSGANIDMSSITTLYREEMEVTTEVSTPRHEVSFTSTEMPFQEFGPNTDRDSDTTLTDMDSDTTLNREQTEVSTEASMTADWIATTTSTATPRADDKAPTTSEVPSTPKQTVLLKELTKDTGGVGATSLPEQKKDPRMDGERSESPATSAVPFTSTTSGNLLTTSNGEHVIDREGNHTQNSSTGAGMVKPRPADVLTRKSIGTAAPPRQPLPTSSDGVDQAHTYLSENGSSAWTTSFGSTITSTTGSEDSGPPAAEVPNFTKQADLLNEPTKETGAEKGIVDKLTSPKHLLKLFKILSI